MAVFNFNGRQRKHEIELANMQYAARMRELDKSLTAAATEGREERKFRGSEGEANRGLAREEGKAERDARALEGRENRGLSREEGRAERFARAVEGFWNRDVMRKEGEAERTARAKEGRESRKHATKSQKLNFSLGIKAARQNREMERDMNREEATLQSLKTRRQLSLMGFSDAEAAEAELMLGPGLANSMSAQFNRRKLAVRDPELEGKAEAGAEVWRNRAEAARGMVGWEQGTASLPLTGDAVAEELRTKIAALKANRALIEKDPSAAVPSIYNADSRLEAAKVRQTVRPDRRKVLEPLVIPPEVLKNLAQ